MRKTIITIFTLFYIVLWCVWFGYGVIIEPYSQIDLWAPGGIVTFVWLNFLMFQILLYVDAKCRIKLVSDKESAFLRNRSYLVRAFVIWQIIGYVVAFCGNQFVNYLLG